LFVNRKPEGEAAQGGIHFFGRLVTAAPAAPQADAAFFEEPAPGLFLAAGRDPVPAAGALSAPALVGALGSRAGSFPLLIILGPTASGKSALALALAERRGVEIVNFDSVQVYRGFDVGTGKVPPAQRRGIPHHLLDCVEPGQTFTAGDYAREASRVLENLRARNRLPILVGGTGLYLRALLEGLFEGPQRSETLRARLSEAARRHGREFLHRMLRRLDPAAAARIQPRDAQKIIRALEVRLLAGQPISELQARGRQGLRGFQAIKMGLMPPRAELARRIDARVEKMFAGGLLEETRASLARQDAGSPVVPLGAIGYAQAAAALRGEMALPEALRCAQAATRQYAKRQRTWFRREKDVEWFEGFGDDPRVVRRVSAWLATRLPGAEGRAVRVSE
jgi:tRNA dimethylallyltransferase